MVTAEQTRQLLSIHGQVSSQPPGDWKGPFALPATVGAFYDEVGPLDITIESYGNPYFLPRLAGIWDFQVGYRWHGTTGQRNRDWDDDWLAVAGEGGGVFVLSRRGGNVLFDLHGRGHWAPTELFPDLNTMAACLAHLGAVVKSASQTLTDHDEFIREEHLERARTGLRHFLGSVDAAALVLKELGWVL